MTDPSSLGGLLRRLLFHGRGGTCFSRPPSPAGALGRHRRPPRLGLRVYPRGQSQQRLAACSRPSVDP